MIDSRANEFVKRQGYLIKHIYDNNLFSKNLIKQSTMYVMFVRFVYWYCKFMHRIIYYCLSIRNNTSRKPTKYCISKLYPICNMNGR